MARTAARDLQNLAGDEIGERPKLSLCASILGRYRREEGEAREAFYARVWTENETALRLSAAQRTKERG